MIVMTGIKRHGLAFIWAGLTYLFLQWSLPYCSFVKDANFLLFQTHQSLAHSLPICVLLYCLWLGLFSYDYQNLSWKYIANRPVSIEDYGHVVVYALLIFCADYWWMSVDHFPFPMHWEWMLYQTNEAAWLLFFTGVMVWPVVQEILFRGFLFSGLERGPLGTAGAVVLTTYIWALPASNGELPALALNIAMGALLASVRLRTQSVLPGMLLHVIYGLLIFGSVVVTKLI